uniref:Uncharacterized protein n=1 Tax=viral metagenome TaxID=1070528 RepID=A0A6M3KY80_9ZZZZ
MGKRNLGEKIHVVPLVAAANLSSTTSTTGINMGLFNQVEFIIALGDLATADFTLTVWNSTTTAAGTAIAFEYRVSAAAGTDTMGDVTASESTGLALTNTTYDNKVVIVSVDSDALTDTYKYIGVTMTAGSSATAYCSIAALCYPRYPQKTPSLALT